jgi:hypothetical protein
VRMLEETEPEWKVLVYRALVLAQGAVLLLLRRPRAMSWRNLTRAVAGDPGPLPSGPRA